jgi:hypothetical protein
MHRRVEWHSSRKQYYTYNIILLYIIQDEHIEVHFRIEMEQWRCVVFRRYVFYILP